MSDKSKIEWTDATWNPIRAVKGKWHCVKVSPGCANCYAETFGKRFGGQPYRAGADTLRLDEKALLEPLRWKAPRNIFVCSMTDLFAEDVERAWIVKLFAVMGLTSWHTYQVLTKRADRMAELLNDPKFAEEVEEAQAEFDSEADDAAQRFGYVDVLARMKGDWRSQDHAALPMPNVWLGVSVEDQQRADERIPHLLRTPAAVRWLSCEPLLGIDDLRLTIDDFKQPGPQSSIVNPKSSIDWVICGGESGRNARPMHPDWARSLRDQCQAAGVPFFFKQWGNWGPLPDDVNDTDPPYGDSRYGEFHDNDPKSWEDSCMCTEGSGGVLFRVGKKNAGRVLDGRMWDEMPVAAEVSR